MASTSKILGEIVEDLGPEGPGYYVLDDYVPADLMASLYKEINDGPLPWYPQYNKFRNTRGVEVEQAFDVFAHKLSHGSQEILGRLPALCMLGNFIMKDIIEPLKEPFPALEDWQIDEATLQRYQNIEGRLTLHKDLERHTGIIAICNLMGKACLSMKPPASYATSIPVAPADIVLLRAPELFESRQEVRPEHAISNVRGFHGRVSATFRANNRPDEPIDNFRYHNWPTT